MTTTTTYRPMTCSPAQRDFLLRLVREVQAALDSHPAETVAVLSAHNAVSTVAAVAAHATVLADDEPSAEQIETANGLPVDRAAASAAITTLKAITSDLRTATEDYARWAQHGGEWVLKARSGLMVPGEPVTVVSSRGTDEKIVGEIVLTESGVEYATVGKRAKGKRAGMTAAEEEALVGAHRCPESGCVLRVYRGQSRVQTKRHVEGEGWVYNGRRILSSLSDETRLSAEEAAAFGHDHGACVFCGRGLDDPTSVEHGYGPVCADKFGLPWG